MKARFSYPLVFLLPSAILAAVAGVVFIGVGAGVLWLFIYGDNSWPDSAEKVLTAISVLVAVASLAALVSASYFYGKRQELSGGLSTWHIVLALAITILLPALIIFRQYQIGAYGSHRVSDGARPSLFESGAS